jgi:excisionase family DNA binding protein
MATAISGNLETLTPTVSDSELARNSMRGLAHLISTKSDRVQIQFEGDQGRTESVEVPSSAVRAFLHLLAEMSMGKTVTFIPTHAELTTQQAADLLNVSRPYVVKLLDEGAILSRKVGKYRRVRYDDLMAYKRQDDDLRSGILDRLTAEAQELEMGY